MSRAKYIAERTKGTVWVKEDYAGVHTKAYRLSVEERHEMGVNVVDFTARSPDLGKIELIWHFFKDTLEHMKTALPRQAIHRQKLSNGAIRPGIRSHKPKLTGNAMISIVNYTKSSNAMEM
ncbi:hypothetical protein K469DRAFT_684537 [Zopfia rhizophila CBS 207.26]|uniref:Tc1-like transposase DDE domain-containing protein n=1 Tax=Zopfia rhizophila CBS 207.26 TaxID=1314779 RepID=A0A6A6ED51_9PEZI|nr:hypothetical protein K469DRAFT_684537 [Zopfia rhizophila CBS 207.26]